MKEKRQNENEKIVTELVDEADVDNEDGVEEDEDV